MNKTEQKQDELIAHYRIKPDLRLWNQKFERWAIKLGELEQELAQLKAEKGANDADIDRYYSLKEDIKHPWEVEAYNIGQEYRREGAKAYRDGLIPAYDKRKENYCNCAIPYFPTGDIKNCSRCGKPTVY